MRRQGLEAGLDSDGAEQRAGENGAGQGETGPHARDHQERLGRDVIDAVALPGPLVLGDQHRAGGRKAAAQRHQHEEHGPAGRDRSDGHRSQLPHPQAVDDLVAGREHVREHDRHGHPDHCRQQRALRHGDLGLPGHVRSPAIRFQGAM